MKRTKLSMLALLVLATSTAFADSSVWQWSNSGQYYYYRDNDGRVHYSDGSVSAPSETWTGADGKTVYRANSAGPKDQTGQYAVQAPRIDESSVGPAPKSPPANAVLTYNDPSKPTFGPAPTGPTYIAPTTGSNTSTTSSNTNSNSGSFEFSIKPTPAPTTSSNTASTNNSNSVWQWSNSGQYYYYRDNDGRVHYSDGSVSEPSQVWTGNDGRTVYAANSAGPKDQTGQYAIQAPRIDESSVGAAPTSPPSNAVLTYNAPSKPTFGPAPTGPIYVAPDSQAKPNQPTTASYANSAISSTSSSSNSSGKETLTGPGLVSGVDNDMLMQAIQKAQNQGGDFNSIVSNPFLFCSGPKPKKGNPLRVVYDMICGDSQKNGQAASTGNSALTPNVPKPLQMPQVPGATIPSLTK